MKQFEEGKRYSSESGSVIVVDRRTAKYLVVGLPDGEVKWAYIRQHEDSEYVTCGDTYYASKTAEASEPEPFIIKKGDTIKTPRFLNVVIEKVFKTEANARKQGYTEPTHYENEQYGILGKHTEKNTMKFAAYEKAVI